MDVKRDIALLEKILEKLSAQEVLLLTAIESLPAFDPTINPQSLQWTASKTSLIELIYALYAAGVFNKGKSTIKDITVFFENVLAIQLGNTSLRFQEILRRKESTAFLTELKHKLELYIERIDEKNLR